MIIERRGSHEIDDYQPGYQYQYKFKEEVENRIKKLNLDAVFQQKLC